VKLPEKRLGVGKSVRLKNNSGWRVLNSLQFICDMMRIAEKSLIGVVKTRTDESMSNK